MLRCCCTCIDDLGAIGLATYDVTGYVQWVIDASLYAKQAQQV
jgi:hypothetical protein